MKIVFFKYFFNIYKRHKGFDFIIYSYGDVQVSILQYLSINTSNNTE